jgi:hypothetical protein
VSASRGICAPISPELGGNGRPLHTLSSAGSPISLPLSPGRLLITGLADVQIVYKKSSNLSKLKLFFTSKSLSLDLTLSTDRIMQKTL